MHNTTQVGQKYGYRPLPSSLPASHFEPMLDGLTSLNLDDGVALLKKWFHKDLNCVPPLYVLQPISSILPNFLNARKVKLQQADQEEWFKTMQELQKYVLKGTEFLKHNNIIPENEYLKFRMSILEREFAKGILEARDTKEDCLAFTRFLTNINSSDQARFPHYVDTNPDGSQDMVALEAVNQLREDKLGSVIYKRNLKSYRINWNNKSGLSLETHDQYIRDFVGDFYKAVVRLADRGAKKFDCSELGVLKLELQGALGCSNLS